MVLQGRLQDEARITQGRVKGHLQEGEREPVGMVGGSGRSGIQRQEGANKLS